MKESLKNSKIHKVTKSKKQTADFYTKFKYVKM